LGLKLSFSDKEITPWGGMALMSRMLQKIGFNNALIGVKLPAQGSNRGYSLYCYKSIWTAGRSEAGIKST